MNITLHRRAEIAFRLLDINEQQQLSKAFEKLITANEDFVFSLGTRKWEAYQGAE